jgi:hypothetical protein
MVLRGSKTKKNLIAAVSGKWFCCKYLYSPSLGHLNDPLLSNDVTVSSQDCMTCDGIASCLVRPVRVAFHS